MHWKILRNVTRYGYFCAKTLTLLLYHVFVCALTKDQVYVQV